jgi:glycosyltransferase involved in cell wall biosynthesis
MYIVHTEASLGFGGQEMRILNEAQGLQQRGHRLALLCPPEAEIYRIAQQRGLHAVALPIGKKRWVGFLALYRWLKSERPDVVNTHSSTDSWLTALACLFISRPPAIVRSRHISAPISRNRLSRWLYTSAARHVVTTGEKLRRTLIEHNGYPAEQITSIRTGIDLGRFRPGDRQDARRRLQLAPDFLYIGIVATLRSWKGHRYLLQAFANLPNRQNLRLLVVGDGPQQQALADQALALGIGDAVQFAGRQGNVETWMQALDIFCLPSYANEGVPQALMQSQACGLPAVTTLVGSIDEAVVPGVSALIVEPEQVEALQQALLLLIDDAELRQRMGQAAAKFAAAQFSDQVMLDRMQRVFEQAVAQNGV